MHNTNQISIDKPSPLVQSKGYFPKLEGELQELDLDREKREKAIWYALWTYGFLVEKNRPFRLCYLAEKIRENYDGFSTPRSGLVADLLILNSYFYAPFLRYTSGEFVQIDSCAISEGLENGDHRKSA